MNPDYIPPQYGIPAILIMWLILLAMILWDRRKLNRALKERPSLKILKDGKWVDAGKIMPADRGLLNFPPTRRPVSKFYDHEKDIKG